MITMRTRLRAGWTAGLERLPALAAVIAMMAVLSVLPQHRAEAATTTVQVGQQNGGSGAAFQFNAAIIAIHTGDTAHWVWFNGVHAVVSYAQTGGVPDWRTSSNLTGSGQSFDHTFASNGTFTYYCDIHALRSDADPANINASIAAGKMVGRVSVTPPGFVGGVSQPVDAAALPAARANSGDSGSWRYAIAGALVSAMIAASAAGWRLRRRGAVEHDASGL